MTQDDPRDSVKNDPGSSPNSRRRLGALLVALALAALFLAVNYAHHRYYERQLLQLGRDIVDQNNREDPLPMPAEGPEADVEIEVTCSFDYLVFGPVTGKVVLVIYPRAHARKISIGGVAHIFRNDTGEWREVESYHI